MKTPLTVIQTSDQLSTSNVSVSNAVLEAVPNEYQVVSLCDNESVVASGELVSNILNTDDFSYATVPLGIVLKGSLVVSMDRSGVKTLQPGDFIGLFETTDWLVNNRNRKVGDWSLRSIGDTDVLFFTKELLTSQSESAEHFRNYVIELARKDLVPKSISKLPLLDWVASHTTQDRVSQTAVIIHTHVLPTSIELFRHIAHVVGIKNVFIVDKSYSTIRESLNELLKSGIEVFPISVEKSVPFELSQKKGIDYMWKRFMEVHNKAHYTKVVIIDDGADVLLSVPWDDLSNVEVVGVEQTQRGVTRMVGSAAKLPPIVAVASSGIKKIIESPFIGEAVVNKLQHEGMLLGKTVGVIGAGSIGVAVMEMLEKLGVQYVFYDIADSDFSKDNVHARRSIDSLVNDVDVVIGTTGTDVFRGAVLDRVTGDKTFLSASSSDVEFRTLLQQVEVLENPFSDIDVDVHENLKIKILNGGYPFNFDRQKEWESVDDIVLTRCLLYIGFMQSLDLHDDGDRSSRFYELDKVSQRHLLTKWLETKSTRLDRDIEKVVNATFLEDAKQAKTVWLE